MSNENKEKTEEKEVKNKTGEVNKAQHKGDELEIEVVSNATDNENLKKELETLTAEVAKCKSLADENFKRYQYAVAELENFKKRVRQEREEIRRYGIIPFVKEIIHVVDNLEKALEHLETADKNSLTHGIQLTLDMFNKTLKDFGITQVKAEGETFDPKVHDALSMLETAEHEPNQVVNELQRGYVLDDKLIRSSKVVVSIPIKKEAATEEENKDKENKKEDIENG